MADYKEFWEFDNIKEWLAQTNILTEEITFLDPPPFPYQVFFDDCECLFAGGYSGPSFYTHDIQIEQYQETSDIGHEKKLEAFLAAQGIISTRRKYWILSERMYQTIYTFQIKERRMPKEAKNNGRKKD